MKFGGKSSLLGRSDLYLKTNYHIHLFVAPISSVLTDKKDGLGIDPFVTLLDGPFLNYSTTTGRPVDDTV